MRKAGANPMPAFRPLAYFTLKWIAVGFFRTFFRVRLEGFEHLPADGPVLLCVNHISGFDPIAVGALAPRPVHMMAKIELYSYLGWLLPAVGAFPVNRDVRDASAVRQALRLLRAGRVVGLFPEGHRHYDGRLGEPRPGAGTLIARSGAAVVPVAVRGPWRLFQRVQIRCGEPLDVSGSSDAADAVMRAIGRLYYLPEERAQGLPWAESD